MKRNLLFLLLLSLFFSCELQKPESPVSFPKLISDGMVLQRDLSREEVADASRKLSAILGMRDGWRGIPVEFEVSLESLQQEESHLNLNYWLSDPAREKQIQAILQNLFAEWGVNQSDRHSPKGRS